MIINKGEREKGGEWRSNGRRGGGGKEGSHTP